MSTATDNDVAALAAEMKQLRSDVMKIAELVQAVLRDAGSDALERARATGERAWNDAKSRTDDIVDLIEKRPVASTATAFGIGMLLGMLMHGRK
ncbi:MAG TPA: hypothetical protein VLW75_11055 [Rhizomicrobium sp.]|nr:hypothetical protein [Rhizomicrobium sp.]